MRAHTWDAEEKDWVERIGRTKKCKELVRTQNNIQIVINSLSQTCVGIWDLQEGHRDFQLGLNLLAKS